MTHPATQNLIRAMKFKLADLDANREGKLSEHQLELYGPPKFSGVVIAVILGHMLLVGGLLGGIAIIAQVPALFIIMIAVLGLSGLPFMLMGKQGGGRPVFANDVARGRVDTICGYVLLQAEPEAQKYTLMIEGEVFKISKNAFSGFVHQRPYCLYYLPDSKVILSAEAMQDE